MALGRLLFWFLDAGNNETVRRLSSPEKAPMHEVAGSMAPGGAASAMGIVRSYVSGDLYGGRGASTRRRALRYGGVDVTRHIRVPACQMIFAVLDHALHADNT